MLQSLEKYRRNALDVVRQLQAGFAHSPHSPMLISVEKPGYRNRIEVGVDISRAQLIDLVKSSTAGVERRIRQLGVEPERITYMTDFTVPAFLARQQNAPRRSWRATALRWFARTLRRIAAFV